MMLPEENKVLYEKAKDGSRRLPNKAFDSEYMTEWVREVRFLESKGIKCTYVKRTAEYNIKQYKYKKTPELFKALTEFYSLTRNEKQYRAYDELLAEAVDATPYRVADKVCTFQLAGAHV